MTGDVKVISGTAHPGLAQDVCRHLGIPVCRSTAVQLAPPGETRTVSSEGTTAGPSGVACPRGGRASLVEVSVLNF